MTGLVAVLTALLWSGAGAAEAGPLERPGTDLARALNNAFAGVFEKVAPAVVVLEVRGGGGDPAGSQGLPGWEFFFRDRDPATPRQRRRPRTEESEGSGFFVRGDGYILTNAHVVERADASGGIVARLHDGRRLPAKIVGTDDKTDLAILKVEAEGLPAVEWGDSDGVRVGELAMSIGAPFELPFTFTVGVISAKGRGGLTSTMYEDYLQTDAAINPGNSGGPLCDIDGRVVGVNTLINGVSNGLGFAIPSNLARAVSLELIEKGRVVRPWLGIRIESLDGNETLQEIVGASKGVLVRTIEPETPAYRSQLRPADVILEVDGVAVDTARDLQLQVLNKKVGQTVKLKVWRRGTAQGRVMDVAITTAEQPVSFARAFPSEPEPPAEEPGEPTEDLLSPSDALGLDVQDVTPAIAEQMDLGEEGGVIVTHVAPDSPAALAGLRRRDVITGVGSMVVGNVDEFREALAGIPEGGAAVLLIDRDGQKTYAMLKP